MQIDKRSWPVVTIRVFAVLNLVMGLLGFALLLNSIGIRLTYSPWPQDPPYLAQAYYVRSAINLLFVVLTLLGGIYLWGLRGGGWNLCKVLFISEIAYFFLNWFDYPLLLLAFGSKASLVSMALAASEGTGNMGTGPQTLTGYPVIALVALKIAYGRLPHTRKATAGPNAADAPAGDVGAGNG
jgi:hypothetical protein